MSRLSKLLWLVAVVIYDINFKIIPFPVPIILFPVQPRNTLIHTTTATKHSNFKSLLIWFVTIMRQEHTLCITLGLIWRKQQVRGKIAFYFQPKLAVCSKPSQMCVILKRHMCCFLGCALSSCRMIQIECRANLLSSLWLANSFHTADHWPIRVSSSSCCRSSTLDVIL